MDFGPAQGRLCDIMGESTAQIKNTTEKAADEPQKNPNKAGENTRAEKPKASKAKTHKAKSAKTTQAEKLVPTVEKRKSDESPKIPPVIDISKPAGIYFSHQLASLKSSEVEIW